MKRARARIPGGVNSPVRAFGSVGGIARFVASASGARIQDVDGNRYVDWVASWGAIIAGHAHPVVVDAVRSAAARGMSFGAPTEAEVELAERVCNWLPSVEMVRLVNSGTEGAMSAVRLARGYTGRDKLLKFDGCYHGHVDSLLAAAGSGVATLGIPGTQGVPEPAVADTLVVDYNDLEAVRSCFERYGDEIAAVLVEPIAANMGLVYPQEGFLEGLRELCDEHGALLVFDEVICGFRVSAAGAQGHLGVVPDVSIFGKVIGGGLPVGAYGGRADVMSCIAPEGGVYQAGTLSGNPLATAAGLAVLDLLEGQGVYEGLAARSRTLSEGLAGLAAEAGLPFSTHSVGGLAGFAFAAESPRNFGEASKADHERYGRFFQAMLDQGIYLPPSGYEALFLTLSHGDAEIAETLEAARRSFKKAG